MRARSVPVAELPDRFPTGTTVAGIFRGAWNPAMMLAAVLFGVVASMVIVLLRARRALKLDVVQCLRYE